MKTKKLTYKKIKEWDNLDLKVVDDFLPKPTQVVSMVKPNKKVTIALEPQTIAYFKNFGSKNHVPYQRIIRDILSRYVQNSSNQKSI